MQYVCHAERRRRISKDYLNICAQTYEIIYNFHSNYQTIIHNSFVSLKVLNYNIVCDINNIIVKWHISQINVPIAYYMIM